MKRILSVIIIISMLGILAGCGTNKAENDAEKPAETVTATDAPTENMADGSDAIVVYFSRAGEQYKVGNIDTGNTAVVAEMIAEKTGADIFEITPADDNYPMDSYDDLIDYAKQEQNDNARPKIDGDVENFEQYSTVFLGYPIWWGDLPMIVYTFLENYDFEDKTILPFCTHEGSGNAGTKSKIEKAIPSAIVEDVLAIRGEEAQKQQDSTRDKVNEWLEGYGY
ncbi:MAG: flavodoxin [Clostridia bacterium]|nr:flavodoxin [Clostridia bacterium]